MGIAGLVDLKKRIKSIENTQKLTNAMALVATSKLKKTRNTLKRVNSYFESYNEIMEDIMYILPEDSKFNNRNKQTDKELIIIITSDIGLCGSYNFNILDKVREFIGDKSNQYYLLIIGERGKSLFKRYDFNILDYEYNISDIPNVEQVRNIYEYGLNMFLKGEVSGIILAYTWFKNPLIKEAICKTILPINIDKSMLQGGIGERLNIEGDKEKVLDMLISSYCNAAIFNGLINAKASEQGYRMETMNSASKNAGELITNLEIKYNRIRQSAITQEISEIVGGSEAQV